jgi:hypothetical protein
MRPSVALTAPKRVEVISACKRCADTGLLDVDRPCSCKPGIEHAAYMAILQSPPSCVDCDKAAEFMLLSDTPRCKDCDFKFNVRNHGKRTTPR